MKAISSSQFSRLAAQTLRIVGVILILSFLLDFVILSYPFRLLDKTWQIGFATSLVDRGIIPMIGLALLFVGHWIDNTTSESPINRKSWQDLRFWGLLLSSLLGILFLILFPLHLNNVRQASAQAITRLNQEATQAESQLQTQLGSQQAQTQLERQQSQLKTQLSQLLQDEQRLNQALQSEQLPEAQRTLLQQLKSNPTSIDRVVEQQFGTEALRNRALTQIRTRKEQVAQQTAQEAWKSGLRIGISSLLLSIGYIVIGATGLKSMGVLQPGRRKSATR